MIPTDRLSEVFVDVADTLVDDFDVVDFLHDLTVRTADVSGMDAAGLLLSDHRGHLVFMAASAPEAEVLGRAQIRDAEGPGPDCFAGRRPLVNVDLAGSSDAWPRFAPRALEVGYRSVHAFPMRLRDDVIGALTLFDSAGAAIDPPAVRVVQALADLATIALLQQRAAARAEAVTEQLQEALHSRIVIEQAKGAVAQLAGVSVEEAFGLLRARARDTRTRLVEVAEAVLAGAHEGFARR